MMKGILLLALCAIVCQQAVLIASSTTNTIITSPAGETVALEPFHNANHPTTIGTTGASWIYRNVPNSRPDGEKTSFLARFYADCQSPVALQISADNIFEARLNGGAAVTGDNWRRIFHFTLSNVRCGVNTLEITTTNQHQGTPAALIFAVTQDEKTCYQCHSPLSFYNPHTCSCQCVQPPTCIALNPKYSWQPYPVCGYRCGMRGKCEEGQYWDEQSCSCKCRPTFCPDNTVQDSRTCQCKPKCLPFAPCRPPKVWDFDLCNCVCPTKLNCFNWNEATCSCGSLAIDNKGPC